MNKKISLVSIVSVTLILSTFIILFSFYGGTFDLYDLYTQKFHYVLDSAVGISTLITSFIICSIIGYKIYTRGIIKKWAMIIIPIILVPAFLGNALFFAPIINDCYEKGGLQHFYDIYRYDVFSIGEEYECLSDPNEPAPIPLLKNSAFN